MPRWHFILPHTPPTIDLKLSDTSPLPLRGLLLVLASLPGRHLHSFLLYSFLQWAVLAPHGFLKVCSRIRHRQGACLSLHLWRHCRPRPVHLDPAQWHQTSTLPPTLPVRPPSPNFPSPLLTSFTGRWLQLQYLLLRHHRQPLPPAPRKERPQEAPHLSTPRRHQSAGHRRGTHVAAHTQSYGKQADRSHVRPTPTYILRPSVWCPCDGTSIAKPSAPRL